jgi:hypothetical protein
MNASVYFNLARQALQRNNPVMEVVARLHMLFRMLMTYNSNVKLNKYRHSLYMQQLKRMEGFISHGSPYSYKGGKMDRRM